MVNAHTEFRWSAEDPATLLEHLTERLTGSFPDLSGNDVRRCTERAVSELEDAPVRDFVPVLAEKRARAACRSLLAARG